MIQNARRLMLSEVPRGLMGLGRLTVARSALMDVPRGDGGPVMLLPGLFNGDRSNVVLRRYLRAIGYRADGWGMGRNLGERSVGADGARLLAAIERMAARTGQPVALVGISLGGVMARIAARRMPELVRSIVTVSAPFAEPLDGMPMWPVYRHVLGIDANDQTVVSLLEEAAAPSPVPATAIWSAHDGLVGGAICHDDQCRAIEVRSSHLWVQFNPDVLRAVAIALAN
jgi:triacylglycerol lipase